ncbi:MAG: bifunctional oligoribonuclease/PAP phosphatase NrnA, partial [Anaerolineae bacterium]
MSTTKEILLAIQSANQILAITHIGPDGDAFGSLTAVGVALGQLGKNTTLVCDDHLPRRFKFLPLTDQVQRTPDLNKIYDLVISVDCGDEMRMGQAYASLPDPKPFLINIDHHVTNTRFGQINLVGEEAVSTTEVLYDLFTDMGVTLHQDLSICLLTGLVTDTLSFSTTGVNAKTLKIAGDLVAAGADLARITMQALNVKPASTLPLWRAGLGNVKTEGGLIWTTISNEERKKSGH